MNALQYPLIFHALYCEPIALEIGHFYSLHEFFMKRLEDGRLLEIEAAADKPGKFGHARATLARPMIDAQGNVDGRYYFTVEGRQDVAVIPWNGVMAKNAGFLQEACMGMVSHDRIAYATKQAMNAPEIKQIVFDINSPGGQVAGTPELAALIRKAGESKATYAFTDYMMASAAVYAGIQAREVYLTPTAKIGSIGTIIGVLDNSEQMKKEGLKMEYFFAGKHKAMGAMGRGLTDEDRDYLQQRVDEANAGFVQAVKSARPMVSNSAIYEAKMHEGHDAIKQGLADGIVSGWEEFIDLI